MKCEWHNGIRAAAWWADTIYGPLSWCCDQCLKRVGKRDALGQFIAVPASEKLAQLHGNENPQDSEGKRVGG